VRAGRQLQCPPGRSPACCAARAGPDAGVPKRGQVGPDHRLGAEGGGQRPRAGVTRTLRWSGVGQDIDLLDPPALLPPRLMISAPPCCWPSETTSARRPMTARPVAGASCAASTPDGQPGAGSTLAGESRYGSPSVARSRRWPLGGGWLGLAAGRGGSGSPAAIRPANGPAPARTLPRSLLGANRPGTAATPQPQQP